MSINMKMDDFGKSVVLGGKKFTVDEAKQALSQLLRRLAAIGMRDVTIEVGGAIYNYEVADELKAVE